MTKQNWYYTHNNHCICGKLIGNPHTLCAKCIRKTRPNASTRPEVRQQIGDTIRSQHRHMTEIHKERMRATLKKRWQDPTFRAEAIRRMHSVPYVTHHVDLDKTNNVGSNRLKVTASGHNSIHRQSYRYLVETGQILNYVEWFKIKFPEHLYDESRSRDPE